MNDTLTDTDISNAQDELLRDVDKLQDWVREECADAPLQQWQSQWREIDASLWSTPALLAFAFDRGQLAKNRAAALDELGDRFCKEHESAVLLRASELADEQEAA